MIKNSADKFHFDTTSASPYDDLYNLAEFMKDSSIVIFRISSYADNSEKKSVELAKQRINYIITQLIKLGVGPERLKTECFTNKDTNAAKSRKLTFTYLSRDYISKQKKDSTQTPAKSSDDEEK